LGALCIATAGARGFGSAETDLLTELSGDSGLRHLGLAHRAARQQAEAQPA